MSNSELPIFVPILIVVVDLAMAALVYLGVTRLAARPGVLPPRTSAAGEDGPERLARVRRVTAGLLAVLAAAAMLITFGPGVPPAIAGPIYVLSVTAIGYRLVTGTETGRRLFAAVPQTWLTGAQAYRMVGGVFLVAAATGTVPVYFAHPAGWGDIITGLGAILVARRWAIGAASARRAAWVWNGFGLLDLLVAVGIGSSLLASLAAGTFGGSPYWMARAATGFQPLAPAIFPFEFPLALIPAFVVPLGAVLHLLSLRKLWDQRRSVTAPGERTARAEPATAPRPV